MTNRLREVREQEGLSREFLADKLGRTSQTIYNWEKGVGSPSKGDKFLLASILKKKVDELFLD